eukprot:363104-Chlamydomonas_euryale.AAC.3
MPVPGTGPWLGQGHKTGAWTFIFRLTKLHCCCTGLYRALALTSSNATHCSRMVATSYSAHPTTRWYALHTWTLPA